MYTFGIQLDIFCIYWPSAAECIFSMIDYFSNKYTNRKLSSELVEHLLISCIYMEDIYLLLKQH